MAAALELEPGLADEALARGVVLVSPATLYAMLAVIRRGIDSFRLASAARDVVELLNGFREAWRAYQGESERLGRALAEAQDAFDRLKLEDGEPAVIFDADVFPMAKVPVFFLDPQTVYGCVRLQAHTSEALQKYRAGEEPWWNGRWARIVPV